MDHYHRRSNAESVFSAVKRKFGDYIRSRTDTSMKNEALCKLLAYNVTSVIHSQCELGIDPILFGTLFAPAFFCRFSETGLARL